MPGLGSARKLSEQTPLSTFRDWATPRFKKLRLVQVQRDEWLVTGLTSLTLFSLTPCWNAIVLLQDPAYLYFEGPVLPWLILMGCVMIPIFFCISVFNVFRRAAHHKADEKAFVRIGAVMAMGMAVILMFCAFEFEGLAEEAYVEFFGGCATGPLTMNLHQTSQMLQAIRAHPECAERESVEHCHGYQDFASSRETKVLKEMEKMYNCAGFCFDGKMLGVQIKHQAAPDDVTNFDDTIEEAEADDSHVVGMTPAYPPTLFSKADHQFSCDGHTATLMKHLVGGVGLQCFFEGLVLLAGAVGIGMVVVTDSWHLHRTEFEWSQEDPGASSDEEAAPSSEDVHGDALAGRGQLREATLA